MDNDFIQLYTSFYIESGALSGTRTQDNFYALIILFNDLLNKMLWKVMNMGMKCIISRIHAYFGHVY